MSSSNQTPLEPPPPYTDSSKPSAPHAATAGSSSTTSHLEVPRRTRSGIPAHDRRSMEDESRSLPSGWVRQYDSKSHHQFFVDTRASPPRSIWHHPYDDDQYLSTLSAAERESIRNEHVVPEEEYTDDEREGNDRYPLPPRTQGEGDVSGGTTFGRKIKDKLTHSTHEQRVQERRQRDEEEAATYRRHQHIRQQMSLAAQTGVPQLLGKDKDGNEVYIEPPGGPGSYGGGRGYGGGYGRAQGSYGYNPYTQGPYSNPNAKFIRPQQPYGRPYPGYGYGYGGGFGYPLMGLGGGLLLGGLLF